MLTRISLLGVLTALLVGIFFSRQANQVPPPSDFVRGRNNTVLFFVNEHDGLSNVHLATTQALLELYPDIEVHYASFPKIGKKLPKLVSLARRREPRAKDIGFHALEGPGYYDALVATGHFGFDPDGYVLTIAPPGLPGITKLVREMQLFISPWQAEDHLSLHDQFGRIIDEIDPAVVALDTLLSPAIEATRGKNRVHAFITPNTLIDNFPGEQPWLGMLWKYPALGSGFPFPVPWRLIPLNVYMTIKTLFGIIRMPDVAAKKVFLKEHGVVDPINFYGLHRPDVPWLTQTLPGASTPLDFIPQNVTCTGPIVLSTLSAEEQDPELVRWMRQKPTILINLGSGMTYSLGQMRVMIDAFTQVLAATDLQILWKLKLSPNVADFNWQEATKPLTETGRVRISQWLAADPSALMETGLIVTFVTHGGANGYHESIANGVPQVVLPLWVDLYNFAQLAEQIGVGVWGCRETSPQWTPECLSESIIKVAGGGPESLAMREAAKVFKEVSQQNPGREVAAGEIAKLARSGRA